MNATLKATYSGSSHNWKGVVKNENNEVVWCCKHSHHNREQSTRSSGKSALDCAKAYILLQDPEWVKAMKLGGYPLPKVD